MIETPEDDGQILQSVYALISHAVRDPENGQLDQATRTSAWTVRELLFHLLLDAQRALVAFSSPADGPADVDNVTYLRPFRPTNGYGGRAHAQYVTRAAAAYSSSQVLVERWTETSAAAAWAGRREQVENHGLRQARAQAASPVVAVDVYVTQPGKGRIVGRNTCVGNLAAVSGEGGKVEGVSRRGIDGLAAAS